MRALIGMLTLPLMLVACNALAVEDVPATLHTEMTAHVTEAAGIRAELQQSRAGFAATVALAETQAALYMTYNDLLVSTVRVHQTPTPQRRIVEIPPGSPMPDDMMMFAPAFAAPGAFGGEFDASGNASGGATATPSAADYAARGDMVFRGVQMAASITENRCTGEATDSYPVQTDTIYLVSVAENLRPGTDVTAEWWYQGTELYEFTWTAPTFADEICIAMEFYPTNAPFYVGSWEARLVIDGILERIVPFTIY